jgi:hypothetical protein
MITLKGKGEPVMDPFDGESRFSSGFDVCLKE